MTFYIFHRHRVCLVDRVDLIYSLCSWLGGFWIVFLSHTAPGFQLWFYFHFWIWVVHWGLLLRLPWRTWVCPCDGQVWRWCSCLSLRGSGNTRYSEEFVARAVGNIVLYKSMAPVLANTLQYSCLENPSPWQRSLAGHSPHGLRVVYYKSNPERISATFFACDSSAPVRTEDEGSAAAWLVGTLAAGVQRRGLPLPQELWPS